MHLVVIKMTVGVRMAVWFMVMVVHSLTVASHTRARVQFIGGLVQNSSYQSYLFKRC